MTSPIRASENNKSPQDYTGFWFEFEAHQRVHTLRIHGLVQQRIRAKRQVRWCDLYFPRPFSKNAQWGVAGNLLSVNRMF